MTEVIKVMEYRKFAGGANIVTEGEPGSELMVIMDGSATVIKGSSEEIASFETLDIIGEAALVRDNHVRTATVKATSDVGVMVLSRTAMMNFWRTAPSGPRSTRMPGECPRNTHHQKN